MTHASVVPDADPKPDPDSDPGPGPAAAGSLGVPPGAATGIGSLPGTDPREAARLVLGELPDLPHLPELPQRGPGADLVGRAAGLLVDLHVDLQPAGWRLVDRAGVDERRAAAYLRQDLDALEEAAQGFAGVLKLQVAGPLTLAAVLELPRGDKVVGDPGARRDLAASLAEGVAAHVAEVRRRLPDVSVLLQADEPSLPAVLAGRLRTASGFGALPAVAGAEAQEALRSLAEAAGVPVIVHCCGPGLPVGLALRAGAAGVSLDGTALTERDDQALGEAVEAGARVFLGVVPGAPGGGGELSDPAATVDPVRRWWRRLGFPAERLPGSVVLTPTCGLGGASPSHARAAMTACRAAGRLLLDDPEG